MKSSKTSLRRLTSSAKDYRPYRTKRTKVWSKKLLYCTKIEWQDSIMISSHSSLRMLASNFSLPKPRVKPEKRLQKTYHRHNICQKQYRRMLDSKLHIKKSKAKDSWMQAEEITKKNQAKKKKKKNLLTLFLDGGTKVSF